MKKFIIPLVAVAVGATAAITLVAFKAGNVASAENPKPPVPDKLPNGCYYINGNPENDKLYLVVDGKDIHFESSTSVREEFKALDMKLDERYLTDDDALERQTDQTMKDWGAPHNTYQITDVDMDDFCLLSFYEFETSGGFAAQGFEYFWETNTISGWAGDFVLYEGDTVSTDNTEVEELSEKNADAEDFSEEKAGV